MRRFINYLKDAWTEMKFVSWPKKADIKEGTTVVVAMSIFVAVFLFLVDSIYTFVIGQIF